MSHDVYKYTHRCDMEIETGFHYIESTGGEICHFKLLNYLYLTIMWCERTQFSNSTFWRLVFSHSWFRIHLQLDFVSLEMNYEPLVWEHVSKMFRWRTYNSHNIVTVRNVSGAGVTIIPFVSIWHHVRIFKPSSVNINLSNFSLCDRLMQ